MRILPSAALMFLCLTGCNKAEPPDQVAGGVAAAQQKAAEKVEQARQDAAKNSADAAREAADHVRDLKNTDAQGAYDLAMAKAEGDHAVAVEKCMVLAGDAQRACKDQADANQDLAKAKAKAQFVAQQQ